ncbi:MAG: CehA/McbA family metallohydrolase [Cyclobacteriaceae bacterium]
MRIRKLNFSAFLQVLLLISFSPVFGQFTNRYPKVDTYRHHIYLEAFDFPFYSNGPASPVASPDGTQIAFSAFGWIWIYDRSKQEASRITQGGEMDFLPTWAPNGKEIAFVRDTGTETYIQMVNVENRQLTQKIDHPNASELDPYYSRDGKYLYYASSIDGTFDIWRTSLESDAREKLFTANLGMEFRPVPIGSDGDFYYISKAEGVVDRINFFNGKTKDITTVDEGRILSQLWMDANESGDQLAMNWSNTLTWDLFIKSAKSGTPKLELFSNEHYVTYPSWDRATDAILFSMAEGDLVFNMFEISANGGVPTKLEVRNWNWNDTLRKNTIQVLENDQLMNARVSIEDENGHYIIPQGVVPRFDSQNGEIFFYTTGEFEISVPARKIKIKASHGLFSLTESDWIDLEKPNGNIFITLTKGWGKTGWLSGDHHFHMNYGGPFKLQPSDLVPILQAEALDFGTPMSANLHFQLKDQEYMSWEKNDELPRLKFGQEIRSHFHGHVGLFGDNSLYWPWFWGPILYETRTFDDRTNNEPLLYGRQAGSIGTYVHPIGVSDPFADDASMSSVPAGLVADVVNRNLDGFEMACLWSDELGSSRMFHQFLNLGIPVAMTAGTDAFPGYSRTMAVGTTRILVDCGDKTDWDTYLNGIRSGNSFITNGPAIDLIVDERGPGEIIKKSKGKVNWRMEVYTSSPLDQIELLVNGKVVWRSKATLLEGTKTFFGKIAVPPGGWVAARVVGRTTKWPMMDSYPFAHTSPIWFNKVGSVDKQAQKESARLLLKTLQLSWSKINAAYGEHSVDDQAAYFNSAEQILENLLK